MASSANFEQPASQSRATLAGFNYGLAEMWGRLEDRFRAALRTNVARRALATVSGQVRFPTRGARPGTSGQSTEDLERTEARVQLAISEATAYADERIGSLAEEVQALRQHLPAFLNAVATVPALGREIATLKAEGLQVRNEHALELKRLDQSATESGTDRRNLWNSAVEANRNIGDLQRRLEFVRKEIMYEVRFGLPSGKSGKPSVESRIVNEAKVEQARASGAIRLNLGCGHVPLDGYINIDARDLPGVDIVADVGQLPFERGEVREIASFHVLEHFPQEQLRRLLQHRRELLGPSGTFRAVVPDGEAMLASVTAGTYTFEDFRMVLFGAQEYEGDFHFNMFTPQSLAESLSEAGFHDVHCPVKGRKNDISFEFEIVAIPS